MRIPVVQGVIDRRILVNYRVDPQTLGALLPQPFRPKLHNGDAIAGICLIRLKAIRPRGLPAAFGISSENAAHRIAVQWDTGNGPREGVYIPRRDSSSRINTLLGGRLFPGVHHHATFRCMETDQRLEVGMRSRDGEVALHVIGEVADGLPSQSGFQTLAEVSAFFENGSIGYSVTAAPNRFDGLELRTMQWRVEPLHIERVASSFFDDRIRFPSGSVSFDCALLMRNIAHEWHGHETLCSSKAET